MGEPFRHRLRVRYHECDPQGVVFNANYLAYFDLAITELWREAFGSYDSMLADGVDMVVGEARVRYLAPLRFDEEFVILVTVADMGTTSLRTEFSVQRDGEPAAEGELRHVFVDPDTGEKEPIPESIRGGLERYADS
ncbi:MAG TPA: thioesterase family protein [Solirubrobacterales bacterium]